MQTFVWCTILYAFWKIWIAQPGRFVELFHYLEQYQQIGRKDIQLVNCIMQAENQGINLFIR